jgi:hypothetical protein
MILMLCIFVGGWTPVYSLLIIGQYTYLDPLIFPYSVIVGAMLTLAITINLFMYNHELRGYLINKVRQVVRRF